MTTVSTESVVIAHLSDCHLPPVDGLPTRYLNTKRALGYLNWQRKRRNLYRREAADALVADAWAQGAQHLVVTGDLVNIGLPSEYETALDWLSAAGDPGRVSVVPGNHDIYVEPEASAGIALWGPYMADDAFGRDLPRGSDRSEGSGPTAAFPYVRRLGPIAIVGVNSSCPTAVGYAGGTVGPMQRRRLAVLLEHLGALGLVRVVLIHHPPKVGVCPPGRALGDVAEVEAIIARSGAELVLHGHNHIVETHRIGATRVHGIASAGMRTAYHKEPAARYGLIRIARKGDSARIETEIRGIDRPDPRSASRYVVRSFGTSEFRCDIPPATTVDATSVGEPVR
jgi:3',5'-cyclic AMP phosphodiesterase CpdA